MLLAVLMIIFVSTDREAFSVTDTPVALPTVVVLLRFAVGGEFGQEDLY